MNIWLSKIFKKNIDQCNDFLSLERSKALIDAQKIIIQKLQGSISTALIQLSISAIHKFEWTA